MYVWSYLINCEYFNNLNGGGYYGGNMYIPIPNWKSQRFSIPIHITQPMREFLVKMGTNLRNTQGVSLFAISNYSLLTKEEDWLQDFDDDKDAEENTW